MQIGNKDIMALGPCKVTFDATANGAESEVIIDITLKEEDVIFTATDEKVNHYVDQLGGPFISYHIEGEDPANLTLSALIEMGVIPNLSNAYEFNATKDAIAYKPLGKQVLFGVLRVHPISAGTSQKYDIVGKKVSCSVGITGNYKSEEISAMNLTFNFSADDEEGSATYGAIYTMGEFESPVV